MSYTISTHNGSNVSRQHNLRNPRVADKERHIRQDGVHETWLDADPRKVYRQLFGDALRDYNAKVRRDRQIPDYYTYISKSATQHPVYEMIAQVGSMDARPDTETGKQILRDWVDGWQQRNPNLVLVGVYYHDDEQGAPHLHVDYVPVAHGYQRGMETQAGLVRALGEQGFEINGRETAQICWQRRENKALEALCQTRGLDITHPTEKAKKHVETKLYKARQEAGRQETRAGKISLRNDRAHQRARDAEERATRLEELADQLAVETLPYERLRARYEALRDHIGHYKGGDKALEAFDRQQAKWLDNEVEYDFQDH